MGRGIGTVSLSLPVMSRIIKIINFYKHRLHANRKNIQKMLRRTNHFIISCRGIKIFMVRILQESVNITIIRKGNYVGGFILECIAQL